MYTGDRARVELKVIGVRVPKNYGKRHFMGHALRL